MLPVNVITRPARIFFSRSRSSQASEVMEMREGPSNDTYMSSGYAANHDVEDAILKKNNDEVDVRPSLVNVISRDITSYDENDVRLMDKDKDFPDGGLQAWLAVFGSFLGLIPVFGFINSLGAVESYISKHQLANVSSSTISWIFSLYLAISFLSCIFAGGYFDRNGSRTPMCTGTLMYVGGIMCLANCKKVWEFILAFSVLCGTGTGILMTPLVSVIATWFYEKRAVATSVATMGGSVGGIFLPIMLRKLYLEVGFQWALRIVGFVCLACLVVSIVFSHEREKSVAVPFGSKTELIKWYFASSLNWRYFLDWKFLFAALGSSLAESSLTASATYLASYSLTRGNSEAVSYALITTTNAVGILGRYIPGYISDKYLGRFNVVIITIFMAALFNFIIWLPFGGHIGALWAYVCLYGFATGSILSLTPVCIGQISNTEDFGKRYATTYFLQAILTIPVLPIGGAIIGKGSVADYNNFIIFNSVLMAVGATCYAISRYICVGARFCKF